MNYKEWKRQRRVPKDIRLRAGDPVVVIAGKHKGSRGKIASIDRNRGTLMIDGINEVTDYRRGGGPQSPGEMTRKTAPIHVSNVMYWSDKAGGPVRIGYKVNENGRKVRVSHKHDVVLDK